jgi:hypothetical protein
MEGHGCRMSIIETMLALPVGRDLNNIAAQRVMGWYTIDGEGGDQWKREDKPSVTYRTDPRAGSVSFGTIIRFSPSTDLTDVWMVIDRMKEIGFGLKVYWLDRVEGGNFDVFFERERNYSQPPEPNNQHDRGSFHAKKFPEAVTRAALKTILTSPRGIFGSSS